MNKCFNCEADCENKFCSRSCAAKVNNLGRRRHGKAPRECQVCKSKSLNSKYCSRKCMLFARKEKVYDRIRNGKYTQSWSGNYVLRDFLILERGRQCERCRNTEWLGEKIPLSVHHEDGDASNNDPKNISLLCLNCHGLTPNYGRKNKNGTRKYRYALIG